MDHLHYLCLVFVMFLRLFIAALWSPARKGLTSWLLLVMFNCIFVTFPCGVLGQVWYLIVLIPDLCRLSYFHCRIFSWCRPKCSVSCKNWCYSVRHLFHSLDLLQRFV